MKNLSKAAQYTLQFINQTNKSVFLTGKAGTGKTTLLKEIIATSHKTQLWLLLPELPLLMQAA